MRVLEAGEQGCNNPGTSSLCAVCPVHPRTPSGLAILWGRRWREHTWLKPEPDGRRTAEQLLGPVRPLRWGLRSSSSTRHAGRERESGCSVAQGRRECRGLSSKRIGLNHPDSSTPSWPADWTVLYPNRPWFRLGYFNGTWVPNRRRPEIWPKKLYVYIA